MLTIGRRSTGGSRIFVGRPSANSLVSAWPHIETSPLSQTFENDAGRHERQISRRGEHCLYVRGENMWKSVGHLQLTARRSLSSRVIIVGGVADLIVRCIALRPTWFRGPLGGV